MTGVFLSVIWYPLLHSSQNFFIWINWSWVHSCLTTYYWSFLNVSSDTLYYTQAQTVHLNHVVMNSLKALDTTHAWIDGRIHWIQGWGFAAVEGIRWQTKETKGIGYHTCLNSWQNELKTRLGLGCCRGYQVTHLKISSHRISNVTELMDAIL